MEKGKKNWVFCDGYLPPTAIILNLKVTRH